MAEINHVFAFDFTKAGCRLCGGDLEAHRNPGLAYEHERNDAIRVMVDRVVAASVEAGLYTAGQSGDPRSRVGTMAEIAAYLLDQVCERWTEVHPHDERRRGALPYLIARKLLGSRAVQRRAMQVAPFLLGLHR